MPPFARRGDFWSGLVLAALGAYIVVNARGWVYMTDEGPGPGFFPIWYGSLMVVLSLALVVTAVMRRAAAQRTPFAWNDVGRALGCWAAFVVAICAMPLVGFAIAFALLTWFIVAIMSRRSHVTGILLGVGGAAAFYALFELALEVALPHGSLF